MVIVVVVIGSLGKRQNTRRSAWIMNRESIKELSSTCTHVSDSVVGPNTRPRQQEREAQPLG